MKCPKCNFQLNEVTLIEDDGEQYTIRHNENDYNSFISYGQAEDKEAGVYCPNCDNKVAKDLSRFDF